MEVSISFGSDLRCDKDGWHMIEGQFKTRLAVSEDLEAIHKIEMECFGAQGVTLQQLEWILVKQGENPVIHLSVAYEEGDPKTLTGFVCWKKSGEADRQYFEILDLGVASFYRREGVAETLIHAITTEASNTKMQGLVVYLAEGNPPAFHLFEKQGFVVQQVVQKYYNDGGNALLMAKRIFSQPPSESE